MSTAPNAPNPSASNAPASVGSGARPIFMEERGTVIPSFYVAAHHNGHEDAIVTYEGEPIVQNGETLRVGMVPVDRRYAIGPVENGRAEIVPQHKFEQDHYAAHQEEFHVKGAQAEAPQYRHIPWVKTFVSVKEDPSEPGKLAPLGTRFQPGAPREPERLYSPSRDRMVSREELAEEERDKERKIEDLEAKLARLEAALGAQAGASREVTTQTVTNPPATEFSHTAPCGFEAKSAAGASAHARKCDDCKAAQGGGDDAA